MLLSLPALFLALSVHEFSHGYAAYKMGDPTAKNYGRLSLNPMAHFDLIGSLCLLIFHFGWAKPVPINSNNFRDRKKGIIIVSLAGPLSNFTVAILSTLIYGLYIRFTYYSGIWWVYLIGEMIRNCILLNIGLMIFNLIPIPPLDGSKVLMEFLPYKARRFMYEIERYSFLILILLMNTTIMQKLLIVLNGAMLNVVNVILKLIL
ncbi:MAG: site-2 protease family protein [Ruminococcaceae bacterium]|nr:site-2 protease family protein [Oscillospiraceae bacterium]